MRSKCEVFFNESDFKSATIRSAKTQYEISTVSFDSYKRFYVKYLRQDVLLFLGKCVDQTLPLSFV